MGYFAFFLSLGDSGILGGSSNYVKINLNGLPGYPNQPRPSTYLNVSSFSLPFIPFSLSISRTGNFTIFRENIFDLLLKYYYQNQLEMSVFNETIIEEFNPNDDSNSSSILINLGICSSFFLIGLVIYDLFRYFDPGHCYYRRTAAQYCSDNNYDGTPLQSPDQPSNFPFSWVWPALKYPLERLVETHGLDVAMYICFLQTQAKIFLILTIYSAFTLIPTYVTSDMGAVGANYKPQHIEVATLLNIPDRSPRLWLTFISEVVVSVVVLLLLYWDIRDYAARRVYYRSDAANNPSNYAVLVMDIPSNERRHETIFDKFNRMFPGQVIAVHLVRDASQLLILKTRLISSLNRQRRICVQHGDDDDDEAIPAAEDEIEPDPIAVYPLTLSLSVDNHALYSQRHISNSRFIRQPEIHLPNQQEAYDRNGNNGVSPTNNRMSTSIVMSISRLRGLEGSSVQNEIDLARRLIKEREDDIDNCAPVSHAAFVVFRSQVTTTCAVTAPIFPGTGTWEICRAPDPRAINWNRIFITKYTTRVRKYVSFGVLTAMTIIWSLPSFLIQALGDLDEFGNILARNGILGVYEFVNEYPRAAEFVMSFVPPVLLFLVLLIVPQLFRFVIRFERLPSQVQAEEKVSDFLFFFFVMSNFVYQVSVKTILLILVNMRDVTGGVLFILSSAVPKKATFLMKYVIVNSFMGSVVGMLNTGRLLFRPIVLWRAQTDRDKMMADRIFADYPFAKMYSLGLMISLISLVYSTIAPLFNAVAFLYFGLGYLCSKQVLLFSHRPVLEGGGYLYRHTWSGVLIGLFAHQVTITVVFAFKKALAQAVLSFIILMVSVTSFLVWRRRFLSRIEHGSVYTQTETETDIDGCVKQEIPPEFLDMYIHPGLKDVETLMQVRSDSPSRTAFSPSSNEEGNVS